jgi:hypothetical protein
LLIIPELECLSNKACLRILSSSFLPYDNKKGLVLARKL